MTHAYIQQSQAGTAAKGPGCPLCLAAAAPISSSVAESANDGYGAPAAAPISSGSSFEAAAVPAASGYGAPQADPISSSSSGQDSYGSPSSYDAPVVPAGQ